MTSRPQGWLKRIPISFGNMLTLRDSLLSFFAFAKTAAPPDILREHANPAGFASLTLRGLLFVFINDILIFYFYNFRYNADYFTEYILGNPFDKFRVSYI